MSSEIPVATKPPAKAPQKLTRAQVIGAIFAGLIFIGFLWSQLSGGGNSSTPSTDQTTQPVVAQNTNTNPPSDHDAALADCSKKSLALTTIWTNADNEQGAISMDSIQGQALLAIVGNGGVTVQDLFYKYDKGERYCMAKVHIQGEYQGNSYAADGYMFTF